MPDDHFNSFKKPLRVLQTEFPLQEKEFIGEKHFLRLVLAQRKRQMAYSGERVPWKNHALKLRGGLCARYLAEKFQM